MSLSTWGTMRKRLERLSRAKHLASLSPSSWVCGENLRGPNRAQAVTGSHGPMVRVTHPRGLTLPHRPSAAPTGPPSQPQAPHRRQRTPSFHTESTGTPKHPALHSYSPPGDRKPAQLTKPLPPFLLSELRSPSTCKSQQPSRRGPIIGLWWP